MLPSAGAVGGPFVDDLVAPGSQSEEAGRLLEERFPEASRGSAVAVFAAPEGQRLERYRPAVEAAVARAVEVGHVAAVTGPFTDGGLSADGRIGLARITFDVPSMEVGPEEIGALADAVRPAPPRDSPPNWAVTPCSSTRTRRPRGRRRRGWWPPR